MGLKSSEREKKQIMGSIWCGKVRMGHGRPKVMKAKKVRGWWQAHEPQGWGIIQLGWGSPKNSVKVHGNAKLRKGPRKPKENKPARDAQAKTKGTQEPTTDVIKEPMAVLGH